MASSPRCRNFSEQRYLKSEGWSQTLLVRYARLLTAKPLCLFTLRNRVLCHFVRHLVEAVDRVRYSFSPLETFTHDSIDHDPRDLELESTNQIHVKSWQWRYLHHERQTKHLSIHRSPNLLSSTRSESSRSSMTTIGRARSPVDLGLKNCAGARRK